MADINLEPSNFGIVDTVTGASQELVDQFLDNDSTVITNPDDIKDIKDDDTPPPAPPKKTAPPVKKGDEPTKEDEEVPFNLDDVKDDDAPADDAPPKGDDKKKEGDDQFNAFSAFSKELYNLGAFTAEEGEEPVIPSTPEEFLETFQEQIDKKAETAVDNFISRFGEDYQEAFDAIFVKGVNPREYYQTYNNIQSFSEMDMTQEENQISVVRQTLKDLDYEEEDIKTEIERLKNYGDLEEVSKKHHKVLIKKESQKLQQLAEKQAAAKEAQLSIKKQFASNVAGTLQDKLKTKEFDGIPLNPKLASEVQDMLLTEKWKNSAGETLTDFDVEILNLKRPENHATKVKLALLLKILKEDPTLSTIKKSAVTKQTNKLFDEVVRNQPRTGTSSPKSNSHWTNL